MQNRPNNSSQKKKEGVHHPPPHVHAPSASPSPSPSHRNFCPTQITSVTEGTHLNLIISPLCSSNRMFWIESKPSPHTSYIIHHPSSSSSHTQFYNDNNLMIIILKMYCNEQWESIWPLYEDWGTSIILDSLSCTYYKMLFLSLSIPTYLVLICNLLSFKKPITA
jgi:hypothetical protein